MSPDRTTLDALRIDRANPQRGRPLVALIVTALVVITVAAYLILWFNRPKVVVVRTVVVQETKAGGEKTLFNASGFVTARRKATVSSKVDSCAA